jgi:hypothetical protein
LSDGIYTHYEWFIEWEKRQKKDAEKNDPVICDCGSSITMGSGDHPTFHNDTCPIRIKYEKENHGK